jgi:endonuclease YncB( thermonuclease family)
LDRGQRPGARSASLAIALIGLFLLISLPGAALGREISGPARVQDDATLRISGRTVHLYGIYVPDTNRICRSFERPVKCAPRAALALDFKVSGFVHCEVVEYLRGRDVAAVCRVGGSYFEEGDDLAAYLLRRGWAVALPDAPFEYQALERIARARGLGVWGIPIDRPIRR